MIIVNIKGGLGNQMFQYAFGRAYSIKHGVEFKMDISGYPKQSLRKYELGDFNIKENIATDEEIKNLKYCYGTFSKGWRFFSQKILRKHYKDYHPSLLKLRENAYFDGFFQSEKYFIECRDILLREFKLLRELSIEAQVVLDEIKNSEMPISLHIRRGDYISDRNNAKIHDVCSLDYYKKAIEMITNGYPEATFFIFSDDMDWVKENLKTEYPTFYVSDEKISNPEEIILMSHARHNIIANSSFSWWGAWLNNNPDKIVIAPKKWTSLNPPDHPNIIPEGWTTI